MLLMRHFFAVAFYSIWVMFTTPQLVPSSTPSGKPVYAVPRIEQYPELFLKSLRVVCHHFLQAYALFLLILRVRSFGPLAWSLGPSSGARLDGGRLLKRLRRHLKDKCLATGVSFGLVALYLLDLYYTALYIPFLPQDTRACADNKFSSIDRFFRSRRFLRLSDQLHSRV